MGGKKFWRACLLGTVLLFAVISIVYLSTPKEPRYNGRPLSEWLDLFADSLPTDPDFQPSTNAIRAIGTNAIPFLIKWAQTRHSKTETAAINWLNARLPARYRISTAEQRWTRAAAGFELLGESAQSTWPLLAQWVSGKDPALRSRGLQYLESTKADKATMVPLMRRLLDDPDTNFQFGAIIYFCDVDPEEAEASGLFKKFPQYRDYVHLHDAATNRSDAN